MRIRQVKPAFWQDAKIASLPHDARLFYIGLWMLADDDGWLRWDVAEIGKELYGFEGRASREKRVQRMAEQIRSMPGDKLVMHPCGHVELPKLAVHQHLAGTTKRVITIHAEHSKCQPDEPPRDSPQIPATPRDSPPRVGKGEGLVMGGVGEGVVSVGEGEGSSRGRDLSNEGQKTPRSNDQMARMRALLDDPTAPIDKREMAQAWLSRQGEVGNARSH